jgi:hypothetical protein
VPPPELIYALRVNIDELRPWEYDGMSFWQYERIRHAQAEWRRSQRLLPPQKQEAAHVPPQIDPSGVGPQFAP